MKFVTEYTSTDNNIETKIHKKKEDDSKEKLKKSQRQAGFFDFSKH